MAICSDCVMLARVASASPGGQSTTMNCIDNLGRIQEMKSRIVPQEKTLQQLFVQAVAVVGKLVKTVLVAARTEIQGRIAQGGMLVNQQAFSLPLVSQVQRQMQSQGGDASASFCANKRDDLSAGCRPGFLLLFLFHSCHSLQHVVLPHWLRQIFGAAH